MTEAGDKKIQDKTADGGRILSTRMQAADWHAPPVALFWDQSLLWGLLCVEALAAMGIPFRLLDSPGIREGRLGDFRILLVPGGWAAHKVRTLGQTGRDELARFIEQGGSYLGFCGGAGMALSSPPSLDLVPIKRMPLSERLPSASGGINIRRSEPHPAWGDIPPEIPVSVWWPSQFRWTGAKAGGARSLAVYSKPCDDFQVADICVSDMAPDFTWGELEKVYGINLDPVRIAGHPAIIEAERGKGRIVLSYAHLETPGDEQGNMLLINILKYLEKSACQAGKNAAAGIPAGAPAQAPGPLAWASINHVADIAADLIAFGEANLLWNWRKPWLLNWKRGIRGLEYGTLFITLSYMAGLKKKLGEGPDGGAWEEKSKKLEKNTDEFRASAKALLLQEKIAAETGIVSKLGNVNERVDALRARLFGKRMSHGGLCGALFDQIDSMLLNLIS